MRQLDIILAIFKFEIVISATSKDNYVAIAQPRYLPQTNLD